MKLNLNLDYKIKFTDDKIGPIDVTAGLIQSAIVSLHPQNMPRTDSKIWAGVQDKLFDTIEKRENELELDSTEYDWLKSKLAEWQPPAAFASRYWTLIRSLS